LPCVYIPLIGGALARKNPISDDRRRPLAEKKASEKVSKKVIKKGDAYQCGACGQVAAIDEACNCVMHMISFVLLIYWLIVLRTGGDRYMPRLSFEEASRGTKTKG
jgi:hypothetical protein